MATLLSINNYYYRRGGAEAVFLEHNRLFVEAGWEVVPFAMKHPNNLFSPWEKYFVNEIEFGSEYPWYERLAMATKVVFSFEARRKLDRLLRNISPSICHAHNIYHHISPSILGVIKQHAIPTVLTLHDLKIACPAYTMLRHGEICERCRGGKLHNVLMNRCIKGSIPLSAIVLTESLLHRLLHTYTRNVDYFVVPSLFYREKIIEWGWPEHKFVYIPNFVEVENYHHVDQAGTAFVYFGRLSQEKGLGTLVRAAAIAGVKLLIAGSGPLQKSLELMAREINADVSFMGYLSGEALFDIVRSARAVVLPSEWYENAPMSILEAYALGKPVIGSRIGGIPELIREGVTGITFTPKSVDELANALRFVANKNDDDVIRMGVNAREWVKKEFSAQRYRDRMTKLYEEII